MGHYKIIYIFDKIDNIDIIESEPIPEMILDEYLKQKNYFIF